MEDHSVAENSFGEAFSGLIEIPPVDVVIGMVGIFVFGIILGMLIYLPYAQKHSKLPLERLSGDMIWRYKPDWIVFVGGCVIFLIVSFLLVSGLLREL